jgi:Ca-activated chloride channel family protein
VLTQVKVAFDGFDAYDVQPQVLPDVFANRPVVVFGKYHGAPAGSIQLTGVSGRGRFVSKLDATTATPDASNSALSYLWARSKISELSDFTLGDENAAEVTKLGLQYSLLTKYTSFIAVQQLVRTTGGSVDVDQPQPMPAGVEDSALGMEVGPEPGLPILLALVGFGLILWQRRRARSAA